MNRILFVNFLRERSHYRLARRVAAGSTELKYRVDSCVISIVCSQFGCGKVLSLHEQLCGNRCVDHVTYGQSVGKTKNDSLETALNKIIVSKIK